MEIIFIPIIISDNGVVIQRGMKADVAALAWREWVTQVAVG